MNKLLLWWSVVALLGGLVGGSLHSHAQDIAPDRCVVVVKILSHQVADPPSTTPPDRVVSVSSEGPVPAPGICLPGNARSRSPPSLT